MRKFCLFIFICLHIFVVSSVFAQEGQVSISITPKPTIEYTLPYPGLLPTHSLYKFKLIRDSLLLFFTRNQLAKSQLEVLFSDKQISMGTMLWEKGMQKAGSESFLRGENHVIKAIAILQDFKKKTDLPPGMADKIELALKKHEEIISPLVFQSTASEVKQNLTTALEINHQAMQQMQLLKQY